MAIGKTWAGRIFGTNTGNIFLKLDGPDNELSGTIHLNDPSFGMAVYSVVGNFNGRQLTLSGESQTVADGVTYGLLQAKADLNDRGELRGEWSTSIGSAGTVILFPHDAALSVAPSFTSPEQLHVARHQFGAIEIEREQILALADEIQRDFTNRVIVTVTTATEQSRYLADFRGMSFADARAQILKLFVQEPEENGVNRIVHVEFGPSINFVTTQGGDESWVIGMAEKIKRRIHRHERTYATNYKKFGFGMNQLFLAGTVVFLPSLSTNLDRALLMAGVLFLSFAVRWLHERYLPFAAIYLDRKPVGLIERVGPSFLSWVIAVSAGVAATLLAAYLQGKDWLTFARMMAGS